jgi:hypothetical protein
MLKTKIEVTASLLSKTSGNTTSGEYVAKTHMFLDFTPKND